MGEEERVSRTVAEEVQSPREPGYYELSPATILGLGILLIFLLALTYLVPTGEMTDAAFRIQALEQEIARLERANRLLQAQIAQADNLQHIERMATTKYGMVPARRIIYAPIPEDVQHLAEPTPLPAATPVYPFRSRWDLIEEHLSHLMGGDDGSSSEGGVVP